MYKDTKMTIFTYLFNRFFYRISEFLRHWYFNGSKVYAHFVLSLLERLDRRLAFKITLKHLFQPLYQDRSFIGYVLGFFFRAGRLVGGGIIYFILLAAAAAIYFIWIVIPLFVIFKIATAIIFA